MVDKSQTVRVGVYVDAANIAINGGYGMKYDVLREFACRGDAIPVRLNAYLSYDKTRERKDSKYAALQRGFHDKLRELGYKVILKHVKWYEDEFGEKMGKANVDLDLAVDALLQSQSLDRVLLATGDGDFVRVVTTLQNHGCRVEVVAFDNVSMELRSAADLFMPGYLIPGLLPSSSDEERKPIRKWGEEGSVVRGLCYAFDRNKNVGFIRFLRQIDTGLWDVDTRKEGSPYDAAIFHTRDLTEQVELERLPTRDMVFEFRLGDNSGRDPRFKALKIRVVSS